MAQDKLDCGKAYKGFWEKLDREKYAKISPEQLAGVSRMALRAYDACQAGDEQDARALFERLDRMRFLNRRPRRVRDFYVGFSSTSRSPRGFLERSGPRSWRR